MPLEARVFQLAKEADAPESNQDAWCVDRVRGVAAVADGVTASLFARHWAAILAEAAVADPPDPRNPPAFADWLARRRQSWARSFDPDKLAWFQKAKLAHGAFSTLLWVRVLEPDDAGAEPGGASVQTAWRLQAFAIGDSCLLHVRDGSLLRAFPLTSAEQFGDDPLVLGSVDLRRDHLLRFEEAEGPCQPGDLVILCTDAVAQWALQRMAEHDPPDWEALWGLSEADWSEQVVRLRLDGQMRNDDATLVLLRVTGPVAERPGLNAMPAAEVVALDQRPAGPEVPEPAGLDAVAPPVNAAPLPGASSPPLPPPLPPAEPWPEKLKDLSGQLIDHLAEQVRQGAKFLRGLKQSAQQAYRKLRDRASGAQGPPPP